MSRFADLMSNTGLPALRRVFGDNATYTPAYTPPAEPAPVTTWAILTTEAAFVGQYGERVEQRLAAELPKAAVGIPQPGDTLAIGANSYRVDQVITDDGFMVKVAIR